jgi:tRNA(Ile)-lysidine synthetase-like protein
VLLQRSGELRIRGNWIELESPSEPRIGPFSYTFSIPGEVELPELGLRLRIRRSPVEPWMLRGDPTRAGWSWTGAAVTVRNRRAGDRLRPLGSTGVTKLKSLLIDRRVPLAERDRLPLVVAGDRLVWVPGVTLDEAFRLRGEGDCWLAELEPLVPTVPTTARATEAVESDERTTH